MKNKTPYPEFDRAFNKVKKGKKKISDRDFIKYYSNDPENLNSLGKFFYNEEISLVELNKLAKEFYSKTYKPNKYVCVVLPKGNGDFRTILVPSPRDRILFSVVLERIKPKLLPEINEYKVFGSAKRKDFPTVKAINEEIYRNSKKYKFILKIDIRKFFPSIDREKLISILSDKINDKYLLQIIRESIENKISFKFENGMTQEKKESVIKSVSTGIPQGCAYSPLLANYYGLTLDRVVTDNGFLSFRYLDDMIIFGNTRKQVEDLFLILKDTTDKLGLKIHEITDKKNNKTYIQQSNQNFEYLGIEIKTNGEFEIPIAKIRKEVNLIKQELFNIQTIKKFGADKVINTLYLQLKGWKYYYKKNFETAYVSFKKDIYNKQLKEYYKRQMYSNSFIKKSLSKSYFDIEDKKYYF